MALLPVRFGTQGPDYIDVLWGGTTFARAGNDTIDGGIVGDVIFGGGGNDLIVGNTGDDILTGWAGADTFRFNVLNPFEGDDVITDFSILFWGPDKIDFPADQVTATLFFQQSLLLDGLQVADLDAASNYSVTTVGLDVVIDTPFGNSIVLDNYYITNGPAIVDSFVDLAANGSFVFS
ncbi:M10 family metallopeptidase C-terminal domain-containing protein [Acuticoccus kandeliae]|uniref:M10 family metallopeptidase C-terminal domain-containing protein n=1 Tax=Acuticoccus kandeliae TaxID=2073160 RepID=UPI000D3E14A1|nr:M10 family metallopeptidase C-terminal domain-containing protein [Acuticoccus kandeliae]